MPLTLGALESLEQALADSIAADSLLSGIAVHVDPQKNIVAEVTLKVARLATVIVPYVSKATDDSSGIENTFFDVVPFSIGVFQNPTLVTSGLSARNIAERICQIVKGNSGWPRNLALTDPSIEHIPDPVLNIYQVNGRTSVDGNSLAALPAITQSVVGGVITLACPQPGAAIFYRTDGLLPSTSDTLYLAPFASSGQKIAARAWLQGFLASPYLQFQT
jgi:hypothetical protein